MDSGEKPWCERGSGKVGHEAIPRKGAKGSRGGIPDIHAIAPVDELMTYHASRQGAEPNRIVLSADELRIQGYLRMGTCGTQSE